MKQSKYSAFSSSGKSQGTVGDALGACDGAADGACEGEALGAALGAPCAHPKMRETPLLKTAMGSISSSNTRAGGACARTVGDSDGLVLGEPLGDICARRCSVRAQCVMTSTRDAYVTV